MNLPFAIERLRSVLRRQHKALSTESNYIHWLRHYASALDGMPDSLSSEQKLERFLTDLARHRDLSASSQNQALNAILFFYKEVLGQPLQGIDALRAKRPVHLRHAPTVEENAIDEQHLSFGASRCCCPKEHSRNGHRSVLPSCPKRIRCVLKMNRYQRTAGRFRKGLALAGFEPCEGKLSRTVLRGRGWVNCLRLPGGII